ncbi:hypothetical protein OAX95_01020 [bacterium]|nr:hypothetical protein [bacterium]
MELRIEVTEYNPPHRVTISTIGPILQGTGVTSFESIGDDETVVRFELDISPRRLGRLLLPILGSRSRRRWYTPPSVQPRRSRALIGEVVPHRCHRGRSEITLVNALDTRS